MGAQLSFSVSSGLSNHSFWDLAASWPMWFELPCPERCWEAEIQIPWPRKSKGNDGCRKIVRRF